MVTAHELRILLIQDSWVFLYFLCRPGKEFSGFFTQILHVGPVNVLNRMLAAIRSDFFILIPGAAPRMNLAGFLRILLYLALLTMTALLFLQAMGRSESERHPPPEDPIFEETI